MTKNEPIEMAALRWGAPNGWPKGDKSRVFIADAFNLVGSAMFGENWKGDEGASGCLANPMELARVRAVLQAGRPVSANPSRPGAALEMAIRRFQRDKEKEETLASHVPGAERASAVSEWIAQKGRDEEIATFVRPAHGGAFEPADASEWNVEPAWEKRVRDWRVSVYTGWGAVPHFLFLSRSDLDREICTLPHASKPQVEPPPSAEGQWLSPYLEVMIAAARELNIGPDETQTPVKEAVIATISAIADRRGVEMSPRLIQAAATLLRHPDAKLGKARKAG